MKNSWAQPSLSRDFALLTGAILFVLFLLSIWVTYVTYTRHSETIVYDLEKEAVRIEYRLDAEIERAGFLLSSIGRQITLENSKDLVRIAQLLKAFDNKTGIYPILTWIGPEKYVLVSSNRGVLEKPLDISDRDYAVGPNDEPWKIHIGQPIQGRLSNRWVIPISIGISDNTGRFLGSIMLSMDINTLSDQISQLVRREGISFAIVSKNLVPLTEVSPDKDFIANNFPANALAGIDFEHTAGRLLSQGNLFLGTGNYTYFHVSQGYPYVVLLGYDAKFSDEQIRRVLWSRLIEIMSVAMFLSALLWIVRVRVIRPVLDMTDALARVANGQIGVSVPQASSVEINRLGNEIVRIGHYIVENKRIESELRHKTSVLKNSKEQAEMNIRSKSEYLVYLCQELRQPLSNIVAASQALKDQLYGPLENRKYRQYASDIHDDGNRVLMNVQSLQIIGKLQSHYITINEKPLDVGTSLQKSLGFVAEVLQSGQIKAKLAPLPALPKFIADDFRFQQALANLFLQAIRHAPAGSVLTASAALSEANREKALLIVSFTSFAQSRLSPEDIILLSQRFAASTMQPQIMPNAPADIELELTRALADALGGVFELRASEEGVDAVMIFPASRLDYSAEDA